MSSASCCSFLYCFASETCRGSRHKYRLSGDGRNVFLAEGTTTHCQFDSDRSKYVAV